MALDPRIVLLIGAETAIVDESSYARTLTAAGNVARTTAQAKYGTASLTFDGTGDWVQTPAVTELQFQTGDFTVEAWVRFTTKADSQALFGQWGSGGNSWYLYIIGGQLTFTIGGQISSPFAPTLGQWYHIAVDRSGTTLRVYINGAVVTSSTGMSTFPASTDPIVVGAIGTASTFASFDFNGQMDEVRFTKGLAQYAGAFTPPSGPFPRDSTAATGRVSQVVVETLSPVTSPLQVTQLLAEIVQLIPPAPISATQVAGELLLAIPPNEARVTEVCCELIVLPAGPLDRACDSPFPFD